MAEEVIAIEGGHKLKATVTISKSEECDCSIDPFYCSLR